MIKRSIYLIAICLLFILTSCEEIPVEIPEFQIPDSEKVVLVEELTGVHCNNCPDGAIRLKNIGALYPGRIAVIAIHAGDLSEPFSNSKYDLRSEDGIAIEKEWTYFGKPAAAIDRKLFDGHDNIPISGHGFWQQYIEEQLQQENVVNVETTVVFHTENRKGEVTVALLPLKDLDGKASIHVALTEDHIIDRQLKKGGVIDENYEFEHVLRDMITPVKGHDIPGNLKRNTLVSAKFSFTLPPSDGTWIPENMNIIAFVTEQNADGKPLVRNATKIKLIK
jgi:hypothetical protein